MLKLLSETMLLCLVFLYCLLEIARTHSHGSSSSGNRWSHSSSSSSGRWSGGSSHGSDSSGRWSSGSSSSSEDSHDDCDTICQDTNGDLDVFNCYSYDGCCNNKHDANQARIHHNLVFSVDKEGQSYCNGESGLIACQPDEFDKYPNQRSVSNAIGREDPLQISNIGENVFSVQFGQFLNHETNEPENAPRGGNGACTDVNGESVDCPRAPNVLDDDELVTDGVCNLGTCRRCDLYLWSLNTDVGRPMCQSCWTTTDSYVMEKCLENGFTSDCLQIATPFRCNKPGITGGNIRLNAQYNEKGHLLQKTEQTPFMDLDTVYGTEWKLNRAIRTQGDGGRKGEMVTHDYPGIKVQDNEITELNGIKLRNLLISRANAQSRLDDVCADLGEQCRIPRQGGPPARVFDAEGGKYELFPARTTNNEVVSSGMFALMFVREHNRLAKQIRERNDECRGWSDEKVFQMARKLNIAIFQKIVYEEYLPQLLGVEGMDMFDHYKGYDKNESPFIMQAWVFGGFRWGHWTFDPWVPIDECGSHFDGLEFQRRNDDNHLTLLTKTMQRFGYDDVNQAYSANLRGLTETPALRFDVTMSNSLRNFIDIGPVNPDLFSVDITRNRIHGIPGYLRFRKLWLNDLPDACELSLRYENQDSSSSVYDGYTTDEGGYTDGDGSSSGSRGSRRSRRGSSSGNWHNGGSSSSSSGRRRRHDSHSSSEDDICYEEYVEYRAECLNDIFYNNTDTIGEASLASKVDKLYHNLGDIDMLVGLMSEPPAFPTTSFGPLQVAIAVEQFGRLRDSDRFFYRNDGYLSDYEMDIVNSRTMGDLLHDHFGFDLSNVGNNPWVRSPDFGNDRHKYCMAP